jgi:hypothetical protein
LTLDPCCPVHAANVVMQVGSKPLISLAPAFLQESVDKQTFNLYLGEMDVDRGPMPSGSMCNACHARCVWGHVAWMVRSIQALQRC